MTTHLKPGDRVKTTDGPGTVRAVADLDVSAQAWFGNAELCVVLDCGSKFPFNFIPKAQREPLRYDAAGKQRVLDSLDAIGDTFMIQWLTGVGRFDTNDPCDEWPAP
jgi:hypothetical protein